MLSYCSLTSANEFHSQCVSDGQVSPSAVNNIYDFHEAMNGCENLKSKDSLNGCFENVNIIV